jgi:vacuolar protein sorting-associated protein 72
MAVPDELRRQVAPLPPPRQLCAITGQPARFFDPLTRLPYASLEAYRELRRRREAGQLGGAPPGGVPQQGQQQQQQQQHSQGHVPIALPDMPAMPLQEQQGMPQQFLQLPTAMFQQPQLQQQFPDLPMPLPDLGQQLQPLPFLPPTAAGGGGTFF